MSTIENFFKFAVENGRMPNTEEFNKMLRTTVQSFVTKLGEAVVPERDDLPLLAAAHALLAEALKASLEDDEKKIYETVIRKSKTISFLVGTDEEKKE